MILVDSNVLIDVTSDDAVWREWSASKLEDAAALGVVGINPIVVAEVGPSFGTLDFFRQRLSFLGLIIVPMSDEAAFRAGLAFRHYKANRQDAKATPKAILADFLIGAHAATLGAKLLTRDQRFHTRYFPDLTLITPETE